MLLRAFVLLTLASAGCGSDQKVPQSHLTRVRTVEPGATCANGGVTIEDGLDADVSGVLDDAEVTGTNTICAGIEDAPAGIATRTTALEVGSEACPGGGVRIEVGLDDGAGGGTAGNGQLEDGEVDGSTPFCNGQAVGVFDMTAPAGTPGTSRVSVNGGSGTAPVGSSDAMKGGSVELSDDDRNAISVGVYRTGTADTTFTPPTVTVSTGGNALEVTAGQTTIIAMIPNPDAPPTMGVHIIRTDENHHRLVRGTPTGLVPITGVSVAAGGTLRLNPGNADDIRLRFSHDVEILGTLTTATRGADESVRPSIGLQARNVVIGENGVVDFTAPVPIGGAARFARAGDIEISAAGVLVNRGHIDTRAHPGVVAPTGIDGSEGGSITLSAGQLFNLGELDANGGTGATSRDGGDAGDILLSGQYALVNDGPISARGGNGDVAGSGGTVELNLIDAGAAIALARTLISSADISAIGGQGRNIGGGSGAGGHVTLRADEARIRHAGSINASGGTNPTAGQYGGGVGGTIDIQAFVEDAVWDSVSLIDVSGDLLAEGGNNVQDDARPASSGEGGSVRITAERAQGALVRLLGYASISARGGDGVGNTRGGDGGAVRHETDLSGAFVPEQVHIYSTVDVRGGGNGGSGGELELRFDYDNETFTGSEGPVSSLSLLIAGDVDVSGGAATANEASGVIGGDGGGIAVEGYADTRITGALRLDGGTRTGLDGGNGGFLSISATILDVSGGISARGGGASRGGDGGFVSLVGSAVTVSGAITLPGGAGAGTAMGGTIRGGDGGYASVMSTNVPTPSAVTATFDVASGGGGFGAHGIVSIDGEGTDLGRP